LKARATAAAGVVELTLLRQWVPMLLFVLLATATQLEACQDAARRRMI